MDGRADPLSAGEPRRAEAEVGHRALQEQAASEGAQEGLRGVLAVRDRQPRLQPPRRPARSARQRAEGAHDGGGEEGLLRGMSQEVQDVTRKIFE